MTRFPSQSVHKSRDDRMRSVREPTNSGTFGVIWDHKTIMISYVFCRNVGRACGFSIQWIDEWKSSYELVLVSYHTEWYCIYYCNYMNSYFYVICIMIYLLPHESVNSSTQHCCRTRLQIRFRFLRRNPWFLHCTWDVWPKSLALTWKHKAGCPFHRCIHYFLGRKVKGNTASTLRHTDMQVSSNFGITTPKHGCSCFWFTPLRYIWWLFIIKFQMEATLRAPRQERKWIACHRDRSP